MSRSSWPIFVVSAANRTFLRTSLVRLGGEGVRGEEGGGRRQAEAEQAGSEQDEAGPAPGGDSWPREAGESVPIPLRNRSGG